MSQIPSLPGDLRAPSGSASLLNAALELSRSGFHVFPLESRTKAGQLLQSWQSEATSDEFQIRKWWKDWPDANVAISCEKSGVLVLDVDGADGERSLARLQSELGPLPPTFAVATGRGRHLYFAPCDDADLVQRSLGPQLDVRWKGYVVAPPSVHPDGQTYRRSNSLCVAPLPEKWAERMARSHARDSAATARAVVAVGESTPYAKAALEAEVEAMRLAYEGGRNDHLNISAMKLGQLEAGGELAPGWEEALAQAALEAGLDQSEVGATLQSGRNKGLTEPRRAKEEALLRSPSSGPPNRSRSLITEARNHRGVPDPPVGAASKLKTRKVSEIEERPVDWLDPGFWAFDFVNLFAAPTGSAKSLILYDLAARLTTGTPMPASELRHELADVVILTEDAPGQMLRPRLRVAGADLDRVHVVECSQRERRGRTEDSLFVLELDIAALEELVVDTGARLVIIDPLTMHMGGKNGDYDDAYRAIPALGAMAERTGCAVVTVVHTPKEAHSIDSFFMGSTGLRSAARQFNVILPLPEQSGTPGHNDNLRVLSPQKSNVGLVVPGLRYRTAVKPNEPEVPLVTWQGRELRSAEELFEQNRAIKAETTHGPDTTRAIEVVEASLLEWQGRNATSRRKTKQALQKDIENAIGDCTTNMVKTAISRSSAVWVPGRDKSQGTFISGGYELPEVCLRRIEAELLPGGVAPQEAARGKGPSSQNAPAQPAENQRTGAVSAELSRPVEVAAPSTGSQSNPQDADDEWLDG